MFTFLQHIAFLVTCLFIIQLHHIVFLQAIASYYTAENVFATLPESAPTHSTTPRLHTSMTNSIRLMQDHYEDINSGELITNEDEEYSTSSIDAENASDCPVLRPHSISSKLLLDPNGKPYLKRNTIRISDVMEYVPSSGDLPTQSTPHHSFTTAQFTNRGTGSNVNNNNNHHNRVLTPDTTEIITVSMPVRQIFKQELGQFNIAMRGVYRNL